MRLYGFCMCLPTAEGYVAAIGGLCRTPASVSANPISFGSCRDSIVIDVRLSQILRKQCPADTVVSGASIHIPNTAEPCGGVAGDPFASPRSANGGVQQFSDGLIGFAIPGALSVIGDFTELELRTLMTDGAITRPKLERVLEQIRILGRDALLISDGSGGGCGCAAVLSQGKMDVIFLEEA